jgi:hypothetical protein
LSDGFDDLDFAVAGVDLFAQADEAEALEGVYVARDGAAVAAQFDSEGGDAETLFAGYLAKAHPIRGKTLEHLERVLEGDDLFGLKALTPFHSLGAVKGTAYMSVKSVGEYFNFHSSS